MAKKKNILFFIESFSGGGAEKVLLTILQNFNYGAYSVTLLVCSDIGIHREKFHALPIEIQCIFPNVKTPFARFISNIKYKLFYRILPAWLVSRLIIHPNKYDTIIAFIEGYCTKLLSYTKHPNKIAWVHIDLYKYPWTIKNHIFSNIDTESSCYKRYNKVVCVSKSVEKVMQTHYGLSNTVTIYNPINEDFIKDNVQGIDVLDKICTPFNIVVIGRLVPQKGIDKLLPIIKKLKKDNLKFTLHVVGDGQERNKIESQISSLDINDCVVMHGFVDNPYPILSKMNLLVCPSIAEGFSLVIAEALYLGIPVISMNCSGPNELLDNGKYGDLCNDYNELYNSIKKAICNQEYLTKLRMASSERKSFFNTSNTIKQIEQIL